jgi:hypothetical protein
VTIDTRVSVTIARPDIIAGLTERDPSTQYALQTASGETLPTLKEASVKLTRGQCPLTTWKFIANIKEDFILGLNIIHVHDASMDLRLHML